MMGRTMLFGAVAAGVLVCAGVGVYLMRGGGEGGLVRVGTISHGEIKESSGIVGSRQHEGVFWTHNDKGNAPLVFAIGRDGKFIGEFRLATKNADWEDIAADGEGNLYLAMTGNNDGKRKEVEVARFEEPDPQGKGKRSKALRIREMTTWRLRYPGKPFDAESLFIHGGYGHIISKESDGRAPTMYRFSLVETEEAVTLERVGTIPVRTPVTGAAISEDGTTLAVLSRGALDVFRIDGDVAAAGTRRPMHFSLPDLQFEGCCFTGEGILMSAESRELYLLPVASFR
ncbi:MAG: hypothetical protein NTU53_15520 [Planctomycetota bacterium]|nr:hypothetical protein [Planctomycetota bacterium]